MKNSALYPILLTLGLTAFIYVFYFTSLVPPQAGLSPFEQLLAPLTLNNTSNPFAELKQEKFPKVPILMYHYVEYNTDEKDYLRDSLNIEPHIFERQILSLKQNGYSIVTPNQIYGTKNKYKKPIILSFDDGYEDFYTDVFPLLKKHNVPAVSYIIVNSIGKPNYMNLEQISEISKSGLVEFGSHTMNHSWLKGQSEEKINSELVTSKTELENLLNLKITSVAYPYGVYDSLVLQFAQKAGYTNAVSTDEGVSDSVADLYKLKRIRPGYNVGSNLVYLIEK